jgi:hypothetical protein
LVTAVFTPLSLIIFFFHFIVFFFFSALVFVVVVGSRPGASSTSSTAASSTSSSGVVVSSVWRVFRAFDFVAFWTGNVSGFGHTFFSLNNVEKYFFAVADGSEVFVLVVFGDCRLVHEHVLVGVVSVDETVAVSHVEPFHATGHAMRDYGFFAGGWRVSSGLFVVILGLFSVDVGGGLFLDGLFSNFSGHLVVIVFFCSVVS